MPHLVAKSVGIEVIVGMGELEVEGARCFPVNADMERCRVEKVHLRPQKVITVVDIAFYDKAYVVNYLIVVPVQVGGDVH